VGGVKIIRAYPPNIEAIRAAFDLAGYAPLFAYGDAIYAPLRTDVPPHLVAHESVHMARQGSAVESWWERYIKDPAFRLREEIPAHVAEYVYLCESSPGRGARRRALSVVAKRLASPLYGGLISSERARRVILEGASAARSQSVNAM
jgi:hypothetical protein